MERRSFHAKSRLSTARMFFVSYLWSEIQKFRRKSAENVRMQHLVNRVAAAPHPDFLFFRVAVREVEAWLLASDREFKGFPGIRRNVNYSDPESLADPKAELLLLADKSPRRKLREAVSRRDMGGNLCQGLAYNSTLAEFLEQDWNLESAAAKCPSLRRMLAALSTLEDRNV